jgi:hypothetical protein
MPGLAQWFSCNVELAGEKPAHLARTPKEAESVDEIRVPRLDERGATDGSRDSLYMAIAAIALTAAIASPRPVRLPASACCAAAI